MNALRILQTLDRGLSRPCELTIYGRAALALGFPDATLGHRQSLDVDLVLSLTQAEAFLDDPNFWDAQQATNSALQAEGLYVSHIFREDQVILLPDWVPSRVRVRVALEKLVLWRLDNLNLILSKMMRDDPQDLEDVRFLLERTPELNVEGLRSAFVRARVPKLDEIRQVFEQMQPKILTMAASLP